MMELVARYDNKGLSSSFTISGMLKMSQQIKVRVWPLWNQKPNKDIMERFILFSWTPTQIWTERDIFVKAHFPPNEEKIQNVDMMINLLLKIRILFCIKCKTWWVLQTDSTLYFLPTRPLFLSLILSDIKHKSPLLALLTTSQYWERRRTDWAVLSRLLVLGCTFGLSVLINIFFN